MQRLFLGMYFPEPVVNGALSLVADNGAIQPAVVPLGIPLNAQDEHDVRNDTEQPEIHDLVNNGVVPPEAAADVTDEDEPHGNQREIKDRPVVRKARIRRELPPPRVRAFKRNPKKTQRFSFQRLQCLKCLRFFQRSDMPNAMVRAVYCSAKCYHLAANVDVQHGT